YNFVVAGCWGEDAGGDVAGLSGVAHARPDQSCGHFIEVGVFHDDRTGFAAKLQGDWAQQLPAGCGDVASDGGRTGERDFGDLRVADHQVTHASGSGDEVDDSGGHSGGGDCVDDDAEG